MTGTLPICGGCGIARNASHVVCPVCATPYAASPVQITRGVEDPYWVAVRVTSTCRACGFALCIDHLAMDGAVPCTRCGIDQRFDPAWWNGLIGDAHAIGDLGGPPLMDLAGLREHELPRSDLVHEIMQLGRSRAFVRRVPDRGQDEPERAIEASPGNPLCARCRTPLSAQADADRLDVSCADCGEHRRYRTVAEAQGFAGLVAAVADAHDAERPDVRVEEIDGVVSLRCPGCAAPLEGIGAGDDVFTCVYCKAVCRISQRAHLRAGHRATAPSTWWLLFSGPSQLRTRLEMARLRQRARQRKRVEVAADAPSADASRRPRDPRREQAHDRALNYLISFSLGAWLLGPGLLYASWENRPDGITSLDHPFPNLWIVGMVLGFLVVCGPFVAHQIIKRRFAP
jgi:hypothetical protein